MSQCSNLGSLFWHPRCFLWEPERVGEGCYAEVTGSSGRRGEALHRSDESLASGFLLHFHYLHFSYTLSDASLQLISFNTHSAAVSFLLTTHWKKQTVSSKAPRAKRMDGGLTWSFRRWLQISQGLIQTLTGYGSLWGILLNDFPSEVIV